MGLSHMPMVHGRAARGMRAGPIGISRRGEVFVNKTVLALVMAAVVLAGGSGRLHAQQSPRWAIVNVGMVLTKYEKAKAAKAQLEKQMEPSAAEAMKLKKEILEWTEFMKSPKFDPKNKEQYELGIKGNQRKLEDLQYEVKKAITKIQEDNIISLLKEVNGAIEAYAKANNIQIVLGFGEQIDGDLYTFPNITRKMQGMDQGGLNPLYFDRSLEISQPVADMLNAAYQRAGGVIPASATPASIQK
jgi:Skp family chaperone for outer membrane proteins